MGSKTVKICDERKDNHPRKSPNPFCPVGRDSTEREREGRDSSLSVRKRMGISHGPFKKILNAYFSKLRVFTKTTFQINYYFSLIPGSRKDIMHKK